MGGRDDVTWKSVSDEKGEQMDGERGASSVVEKGGRDGVRRVQDVKTSVDTARQHAPTHLCQVWRQQVLVGEDHEHRGGEQGEGPPVQALHRSVAK